MFGAQTVYRVSTGVERASQLMMEGQGEDGLGRDECHGDSEYVLV